ncbi:[citrate (pro-3S)-lyase] ligase [Caballeronia sp. SBC1]|uniref:[citrate (pro-3S)-lyase] ligase n=1 Tax=Caballeronia sp. SBC1 TaxID=2705548 RepID=UPI001A9DE1EE|nr:[citrate (pro-3S)-lyase] ligase [Caballeronia sp. SBC1]
MKQQGGWLEQEWRLRGLNASLVPSQGLFGWTKAMTAEFDFEFEFETVCPANDPAQALAIRQLLANCHLDADPDIDVFVVAHREKQLVACAGLAANVIKCVAINPECRGESLSLQLVSRVVTLAAELGHFHLFLYARPCNEPFFRGCGFYPLVEVPDTMTLFENTPVGISRYCEQLRQTRHPGARIGCIVMNANPFTVGHQYLVRRALEACDWLHVFVVSEDVSQFRFADRFLLVSQGLAGTERLTVHYGSRYTISKATFPGYFLKDKGMIEHCRTAIDLLLFRQYIAPALGITHRFVGTEPFCVVTNRYNEDMKHWLQHTQAPGSPVGVVEISRYVKAGIPVSASAVRRLLATGDFARIRPLVPDSTFRFLMKGAPIPGHSLHMQG